MEIKELRKLSTEDLTKKIKDTKSKGRGGKVIGIEFYFKAEKEVNEVKEIKGKNEEIYYDALCNGCNGNLM